MNDIKYSFFESVINNINIEIVQHGHLFADAAWNYKSISSPFNRLYIVLDGEAYIRNENGKVALEPGYAYLIPLHTTYDYVCEKRMEKFYLHFRASILPGNDIFSQADRCLRMECGNASSFAEAAASSSLHDIIRFNALLFGLISSFAERCPHIDAKIIRSIKYNEIFKYIGRNCRRDLRPETLAGLMGVPVEKLMREFRADMDITLRDYIRGQLVQSAKEDLLASDLTVKEIAFRLGFQDEFYFSRYFKKKAGCSPSYYRTHNRIGHL